MTNEQLLKELRTRLSAKNDEVYDRIAFCNEHKMNMESSALQYKLSAFSDVRKIIWELEDELEKKKKMKS